MYKLCKTEQSAQRQRQLEEGLLQAMGTVRYEEITVSDLCRQMEIPRKSFYRYFTSKDGALHALIDHTLMEFEGAVDAEVYTPGEKRTLSRDLERFFLFWYNRKNLLDALERSDMSGILIKRAIDYALTEVVFPGRFLPGESRLTQNHVVMFGVCGLMSMMLQWHQSGFEESLQNLARIASRLLTQPLFPAAGKLL